MKRTKSRLDITRLPEGGYSLRVRDAKFNRIFTLCLSAFYFLISVVGIIYFSCVLYEPEAMIIFGVMACFFGGGMLFLAVAEDFFSTPWRLDHEGITVCYRHKKPVTLRWSEIQDWGFSFWGYARYYGDAYHFYFSTQVLQAKNGRTKKLFRKFQGVAILVYPSDAESLRNSGLIPYCRARLDGDDETYVPMFRSDYPLNRLNDI